MSTLKPSKTVYFILCCVNVTLALLILFSGCNEIRLQRDKGDSMFVRNINQIEDAVLKGRKGIHGRLSATVLSMRKMALFLANKDLRHLHHVLHSLSQGGTRLKAEDTTSQELPIKAITFARRSLLRVASSQKKQSKTNHIITGESNLPRATKHTDTPMTNHLPHHVNVDVSATFHVDYSSPKTHPPRNN